MVIRPSHISMFKDQTPPWNCTHINKHKNTQTLSQKKLTANIPNPLILVPQTFLHEAWLCPLTSSASTVGVNFQTLSNPVTVCGQSTGVKINWLWPLAQITRSQMQLVKEDLRGSLSRASLLYLDRQACRQVAPDTEGKATSWSFACRCCELWVVPFLNTRIKLPLSPLGLYLSWWKTNSRLCFMMLFFWWV